MMSCQSNSTGHFDLPPGNQLGVLVDRRPAHRSEHYHQNHQPHPGHLVAEEEVGYLLSNHGGPHPPGSRPNG